MIKDEELRKYFLSRYKSLTDIAKMLGYSQAAISKMIERGVSAETALRLEKLSNKRVRACEMRPDLF